jgi:beta-lactamase superfamily II metal-dependent hydrolase
MALFAMSLSVYIYVKPLQNNYLEVAFLDVGQGDAVLVTAPNGNRLLYDSGTPDNKVSYSIEKELSFFDRKIDIFVASHPDSDHIGGFSDLLSKFSPTYYLDGHTVSISSLFTDLEIKLTGDNIKRYTLARDSVINLGASAVVYALSPAQDGSKEYLDTNNSSIVLLVNYGNSKILLMGDLEEKEERRLVLNYGKNLKANILKVGHHGSKSSTGDILIKMVKPDYSIISAGKNNKYGHPSAQVISRLAYSSTTIFETSKMGTIRFRCSKQNCYPTYK